MDEQFESEVKLISNVHHRNLVRLLGCCTNGPERILVYEYMANNSLDRFLFGKNSCQSLIEAFVNLYCIYVPLSLNPFSIEFPKQVKGRVLSTGNKGMT